MPLNFKSKLMAILIWFKWMVDAKGNDSQMQNFYISSKFYNLLILFPAMSLLHIILRKPLYIVATQRNNEVLLTGKATQCTNTPTIILPLQIGRVELSSV